MAAVEAFTVAVVADFMAAVSAAVDAPHSAGADGHTAARIVGAELIGVGDSRRAASADPDIAAVDSRRGVTDLAADLFPA